MQNELRSPALVGEELMYPQPEIQRYCPLNGGHFSKGAIDSIEKLKNTAIIFINFQDTFGRRFGTNSTNHCSI
jgi:hypothetical protein